MTLLTSLASLLVTVVLAALLVVLVAYDLALLREIVGRLRPRRLREWWHTPPGPWREDVRSLYRIFRSAWQTTRGWLRI